MNSKTAKHLHRCSMSASHYKSMKKQLIRTPRNERHNFLINVQRVQEKRLSENDSAK